MSSGGCQPGGSPGRKAADGGAIPKALPFYRARLLVKPGITGWAQINQKYARNVKETAIKLEYDLYYIEHRTILLDIAIILRTVGSVIGFKGQ